MKVWSRRTAVAVLVLFFLAVITAVLVYYLGIKPDGDSVNTADMRKKSADLRQLFEDYWDWRMKMDPENAHLLGVYMYDDKLRSYNLSSYTAMYNTCQEFLERATTLETLLADNDDRVNLHLLVLDLRTYLDGYKHKGFLYPVTSLDGPQLWLPQLVGLMKLKDEKSYRNLLARYSAFPQQVDELIDLMREGMKEKRTPHRYSMESVKVQFDELQVPYEESPFYKPFKEMPSRITPSLKEEAQKVIEGKLLPAFQKLGNFVTTEYMLHLRPELASTSLPGGRDFYQQCLKFHTSTNLTPEEVHELGLQEVDRIMGKMKQIIKDLGFTYTVYEFSEKLRNDSESYFSNKSEIMDEFKDITQNRIIPKLTRILHTLPKIKMNIEPMPSASANGTVAYYIIGSTDGRPGVFAVNTANVKAQPKYEMMTLSLHEGYPGHHLQISHLLETPGLPAFRKSGDCGCVTYSNAPSCFPLNTAYIEGWGLYSEDLGFDLGVFDDLYERYGHYSWEIFRACRLVVDSGLHALGWTRQTAIDFMRDHTASTLSNIKNEVNRYITWPGQACAYKVGEMRIQELRKKAKQKLGSKFNIKDFHDVILNCSGPLSVVTKCVDKYIHEK